MALVIAIEASQTNIPKMAEELKRFVQAYKYSEWIGWVTHEFEFENFMKGLNCLPIQIVMAVSKVVEC